MSRKRTLSPELSGMVLALLVVLSQGVMRLTTAPLWAHYDEPTHYEYMRYIVEDGVIPTPESPPDFTILERIAATYPQARIAHCYQIESEDMPCVLIGHQFPEMPGYYLLQALFQILFRSADIYQQVWLARLVSVLLAVGGGGLGYATARTLFPDRPLFAVSVPLLLGLIGGYGDLMSALNNDVGAVAAFSLFVYTMTRILKKGINLPNGLLLGASLLAAWFAKTSAWIAVPLAGVGLLLIYWPVLPRVVKIALGVGVLAVLVWAVKWQPGVGPLLRPTLDARLPLGGFNGRLPFWYDPHNWPYYWGALRWQFVTFWSGFGNGVAGLPRGPLVLLLALSALAALGLIGGWEARKLTREQVRVLIFFAVVVASALLVSLMRIDNPHRGGSYIPSARHFFIAIVPLAVLMLLGWTRWLPAGKGQRYALAGLVLSLHLLNVWSILAVQLPWFAANWPIGFR